MNGFHVLGVSGSTHLDVAEIANFGLDVKLMSGLNPFI